MKHLQQLIKGFNKSEKKMVRKFLKSYSSNGKSETLTLKLFDVLDKRKKELNNEECAKILFGKDERNRIRVLKTRLKQKVLDALMTDVVLENQSYDMDVKRSIQLKKKLSQFQTLLYSGKQGQKIALNLLNEVIIKSKIFEQYSILIDALEIKKMLYGIRKGIHVFDELNKEILKVQHSAKTKSFMINSYYRMILMNNEGGNLVQVKKRLKEWINQGDEYLKQGNSEIGRYYFNIIKYEYAIKKNNYDIAINIMNEQLKLLTNSESVYRKGRVGATYDYICETYLCIREYSKALYFAQKGKECFKKGELNYAVATELEFRSSLYFGKLKEAEKLINELRKMYMDKLDAHRISTHKFFLANLYFAKKEFRKCKRLLLEGDYEFKKDRTGWEFNLRVLHIMCLIEQDKIEDAYKMYDNLNRLLVKNKEKDEKLSSRNCLILEILKIWLSSGGNKRLAKMNDSELLVKLSLSKNDWDPLGSEIIQFEKWFKSKL